MAAIPEIRSTPRRDLIFILVVFYAMLFALIWAIIKEYFQRLIKRPGEKEKYDEIRAIMSTNKSNRSKE